MVPELPGGDCQAYVSGSVSEFSLHIWEKCFDECQGEWGVGPNQMYRLCMVIHTSVIQGGVPLSQSDN